MNLKFTYWMILGLIVISISQSDAQVRMSISGYSITSNFTDFSNSYLNINSQFSDLSEPVNLVFYDGRYVDENRVLTKSNEFYLQAGLSNISVAEILDENKISSAKRKSKYITITLAHFNSGIQKGIITITTVNNSNQGVSSNSKGLINMNGELSIASRKSRGSLDSINVHSFNNVELHTKVEIGGIPIYVDALGTDYKDPFDNNRNPSYFSFNFLADEWKEKQSSKIRGGVQNEVNEIYPIPGSMKLAANKYDYLDKVFNSESVMNDFGNLKSKYEALIDSAGSVDKLRELLKVKENEILDLVDRNVLDSLEGISQRDSLSNISSSIERLNKYNESMVVKDSCQRIKKSIDDKLALISSYEHSIYSKPSEINKRLKNLEATKSLDKILNYVEIFRVGLINPKFSKYSLATSQNKGAHVGFNFGYLSIESFYAKSLERSSNLNRLNELSLGTYLGNRFTIQYNEFLSNSFFYISRLDGFANTGGKIESQIGYTLDYKRQNKKLKFETIWSRLEATTDNVESDLVSVFSNAALDLTFEQKGNLFKYNWTTNLRFLGNNFADFNNPFLFNNNLSVNSRISFSLIKELRTSIHSNFQEGNIQSKSSALNRRGAIGGSNTFVKQGWPILTHTFQYGAMDINGNAVKTHLQNVSSQFNLEVLDLAVNSSVLFSWSNNTAQVDSLNSSFYSLSLSNTVELTTIYSINLIGDYSRSIQLSENDYEIYSLELSPYINLDNFNFNFGMKYLNDRSEGRIGWLARLNYNLGKNINLSLDLDNSIFERYINELGEIKDNFYERYSGTLNYKF